MSLKINRSKNLPPKPKALEPLTEEELWWVVGGGCGCGRNDGPEMVRRRTGTVVTDEFVVRRTGTVVRR